MDQRRASTTPENTPEPNTPVQYVKGVGPARAQTFAQMGVHTVADLLEYYPRDWVFAPERIKIAQLVPNLSLIHI